MKTGKFIIAALISGTAFIATSAMAQPGGIGGKVKGVQNSRVVKLGDVHVKKRGWIDLDLPGGTYVGLDKEVKVEKGSEVEIGTVEL